MNINRNNYESFFLLYIDNELSVAEKLAVDNFIQVNPDLEEEFIMLQQTVLKADEVEFGNKESLFKSAAITGTLEETLLLHLDNELDAAAQKDITELIHTNVDVEQAWLLLQRTKLEKDESIVFDDKASLYRKERARVIPFPWLRIAAAAMFIGVATWAGVSYLNNDQPAALPGSIVKKDNPKPIVQPKESTIKDEPVTTPVQPQVITEEIAQVKPSSTPEVKVSKSSANIVSQQKIIQPADEIALQPQPRSNNLPKSPFENINNPNSNNTITASVTPQTSENNIHPGNNDVDLNETKTADAANSFATVAAFNELENKNDDHVFFVPEEKVKKTKLGGFFRKVKRVIDRTANVKEANNIKVANLEFAIQ